MSDDNENTDSEGIAGLRKQYETQAKELKEAREFIAGVQKNQRQQTVAEKFKAAGLPDKAASLYSSDDVSDDAVSKWVSDYADVFGVQPQGQAGVDDANSQAAARAAASSFGETGSAPSVTVGGRVLGNPDEIAAYIKDAPYEELVKQGLMPPDGQLFNPTRR